MKEFLVALLSGLVVFIQGPVTPAVRPKPLLKYTYQNLQNRQFQASTINFTQQQKDGTWLFDFNADGKKVTGVASSKDLTKPVVILLRGYADKEGYYPGFGTERMAAFLAKNGFTTLAPEFLGYGGSASPSADPFEDRFLTYTTVLDLIGSLENGWGPSTSLRANSSHPLGIWGHSNGGQIALSILEISGKPIPTVLWNPVSVTFPYSILYYTWDNPDQGKQLRQSLANFERDYDTADYDPQNYLDWINGPILLQQGTADQSVPPFWNDNLAASLSALKKDVTYKTYPGNDHNMLPNWDKAAQDTLEFYFKQLK